MGETTLVETRTGDRNRRSHSVAKRSGGAGLLAVILLAGTVLRMPAAGAAPQASAPFPADPRLQEPSGNTRRPTFPGDNAQAGPMTDQGRLQKMREDERRKRLMADTARLVELTNELRDEVEKSSRDELSLTVIRKATEIEKLAHDVRERMKN